MSQWRVQQWRAFTRQWLIYDAYMQCPMMSGEKIAKYLLGKHIRYYDPNSDFGAHVVVCNTRHVAVKDNSYYWKRFLYPTYTRFGAFRKDETMEELHIRDPTEVLRREVRVHLNTPASKLYALARLHLYPDGVETIPEDIFGNISGVIRRVMPVPKRLDQYSQEELQEFPKLFDWPQDFNVAPLGPLDSGKVK
ncbi:hypothetical protein T265_08055 [Opisthorchis viverrini]|uniref:Ribosomal protein L13 n=1 Tax=Opisthorchis viverrini TaxID=6198 RepID=A0A074ZAX0_OPIVI|nr:hypothetical protein T265_08055 [Opisthorchis viverrini]KER24263.1 hypothetical protein T265_08055 [Opisthorchis viverrini]